ncbi:MAG: hypothetical protein ACKOSO_10480, partial [Actinomycetota bacterium]
GDQRRVEDVRRDHLLDRDPPDVLGHRLRGLEQELVVDLQDERGVATLVAQPAVAEDIRRIAVEEMVAAHVLDPPLVAEAGIGPTWAAAKG